MITITILLRSNKPSHSFPLNLEIDENKKLVDIKLGIHQSVKNVIIIPNYIKLTTCELIENNYS